MPTKSLNAVEIARAYLDYALSMIPPGDLREKFAEAMRTNMAPDGPKALALGTLEDMIVRDELRRACGQRNAAIAARMIGAARRAIRDEIQVHCQIILGRLDAVQSIPGCPETQVKAFARAVAAFDNDAICGMRPIHPRVPDLTQHMRFAFDAMEDRRFDQAKDLIADRMARVGLLCEILAN